MSRPPLRGILLWRAKPDIRPRLEKILAGVRRIRRSCYPGDWDADPLYHVEQELAALLDDMG